MPSRRRSASLSSSSSSSGSSTSARSRSSRASKREAESSSSDDGTGSSSSSDGSSSSSSSDEEQRLEGRRHHRARRKEKRRRSREHRKHRRRRRLRRRVVEATAGLSTTTLWASVAVLVLLGALVVMLVVVNTSTPSSSPSVEVLTSVSGTRTVMITHTLSASANKSVSTTKSGSGAASAPTAAASGGAASLASSLSMTAAAVASLPMPTAAISDANTTLDYIQSDWSWLSGSSKYLSFVDDPFGGEGTAFAIEYPKGSYSGGTGGVGGLHLGVYGEDQPQRTAVTYEVAFSEGFDFVKGGKLPGAFAGDQSGGCTGGKMSEACMSLRLMWREGGAGEVYGYIPTYDTFCDGKIAYCHDGGFGASIERGSFNFTVGAWQTVTEVAVLNSDPSSTCAANGQLSVYLNDELAFNVEDFVFRTNASVTFSSFVISSFFGGSTDDYASKGGFSYYRNFQFFAGSDPSDLQGEQVKATISSDAGDD